MSFTDIPFARTMWSNQNWICYVIKEPFLHPSKKCCSKNWKEEKKRKIVLNKNILKIWSWVHRPYFILIVDIELHRFTSKTESLSTVILKPLRVAHLSLQKLRKSSRAADHFFPTKRLVTIVTKNGFFSFHGNRIYPICRKCVLS